ncbi:F0F1-type ATP synthase membrane subunit b/b' [Streptomyces sp. V4I8]|uniref:hypothetical protein n=1 Tax=Streptomyces sp. V4I8 TaxID=3156469 RepID=UPI00351798D8
MTMHVHVYADSRTRWAAIFAALQLDATTRDGRVHQEARIRRASRRVHELGRALEEERKAKETPAPEDGGRRARRGHNSAIKKAGQTIEKARRKAELAIDAAGIAGDTPAQLMLARHLTVRGRVDDLAHTDKSDPMAMVALLEDLSIVPSAAAIEEGARAALAKKERQEAEAGRDAALAKQAEAEKAAEEARTQAAAELGQAKDVLQQAQAKAQASEAAAESAEESKRKADAEQQRTEGERDRLAGEVRELRSRITQLNTTANPGESCGRQLADQVNRLQDEAEALREQAEEHRRTAEDARAAVEEALAAKRTALAEVDRARHPRAGRAPAARRAPPGAGRRALTSGGPAAAGRGSGPHRRGAGGPFAAGRTGGRRGEAGGCGTLTKPSIPLPGRHTRRRSCLISAPRHGRCSR